MALSLIEKGQRELTSVSYDQHMPVIVTKEMNYLLYILKYFVIWFCISNNLVRFSSCFLTRHKCTNNLL